jgi:hypothetical protein
MLTWTDATLLIVLTIIIANGAHQGFLCSLGGPLSLLIGLILGTTCYILTKNILSGLLVGILSTFLLTWLINSIIRARFSDTSSRLTVIGRIAGGAINLLWGGSILFFFLLILTLVPLKRFGLTPFAQDMDRSFTYTTIAKIISNRTPSKKQIDPALANDPRIKNLLNDPAIHQAAEIRDFRQLFANPVVAAVTKDPALLLKLLQAGSALVNKTDL